MISKLKRRFTVLATVSMIVLMTVLVLIMNIVNFTSVVSDSDSTIDMLSQQSFSFPSNSKIPNMPGGRPDFKIPRGMSPEVPYESRYFTVTVSASGEIVESDLSQTVTVDSSSLNEYINKAISRSSTRGFAGNFRYLKQGINGVTKITFLDCGRKLDTFYNFLWISLATGLLGCIIVFVAFLFVSKKIAKPIAESYDKQKRFISDAGHEIKTPLTIINANIDLLEEDSQKEELGEIRNQTKRLTELTNNLVYLSKMEESDRQIPKVEMPLSETVYDTACSFQAPAASKKIVYSAQIMPGISIKGSPDTIRQLVSILLENAVKYSPESGTVSLSLSSNKKNAVLSVYNTTENRINEADLPYVFDRFYRTDASRNSATGGHGIGLSIAKAVTEAHGGTVAARTSNGNDFIVTVTLPL